MHDERVSELRRQQRVLAGMRAFGVCFGTVQVLTYYQPHPPGVQEAAFGLMAVLAVGAAVLRRGSQSATTLAQAKAWARAGLLLDAAVALGLVTVGYTAREVYGWSVHDVPFLPASISFRMGIGLMLAVTMGVTARGLVRERDRLRLLTGALQRRGEELAAANTALQAARRAQIEFVAVTNHELRTPLTAIKGFARTLSHRWEHMDEGTKRAAVEAIDHQSRRLDELVQDVLTVSSMRSGGLTMCTRALVLEPWLHEAVTIAEVPADVRCPPDLGVLADPSRLLQILVNLLTNAQKYGEGPIVLRAGRRDDRALIEVADSGPGVPPWFVPKLFEEFTQASEGETRTADGYGLGLAIVRYLARALDGEVTYRNGEQGGAVFAVDLPAADGPGHAAEDQRPGRFAAPPGPSQR